MARKIDLEALLKGCADDSVRRRNSDRHGTPYPWLVPEAPSSRPSTRAGSINRIARRSRHVSACAACATHARTRCSTFPPRDAASGRGVRPGGCGAPKM